MSVKAKIAFITAHRLHRAPSQRFRFEQYFDYLNSHGFECLIFPLLNEKQDKIFYSQGLSFGKVNLVFDVFIKRLTHLISVRKVDVVFIHREVFMIGGNFFEKLLAQIGKPIVFDFDDAIWNLNTSEGNKKFEFLKSPQKVIHTLKLAQVVLAGNQYLADFALAFNKNVHIIPSTVDTKLYSISQNQFYNKNRDKIVIGWSGSPTTIPHFESLIEVWKYCKNLYQDKIEFSVVGDGNYSQNELGIIGIPWTIENEINNISQFDIGIMPLPDDQWTRGKCGLKGLTYMAMEKPTIMSSVGVNNEIIQDGVNGYLAYYPNEWIAKLDMLIQDSGLREALGKKARNTVVEKYSVDAYKNQYLEIFANLV